MDKKISAQTKEELVRVLGRRYSKSVKMAKTQILDELLADPLASAVGAHNNIFDPTLKSRRYPVKHKRKRADYYVAVARGYDQGVIRREDAFQIAFAQSRRAAATGQTPLQAHHRRVRLQISLSCHSLICFKSHAMFQPSVFIVSMPSSSLSTSPGFRPIPMFQ